MTPDEGRSPKSSWRGDVNNLRQGHADWAYAGSYSHAADSFGSADIEFPPIFHSHISNSGLASAFLWLPTVLDLAGGDVHHELGGLLEVSGLKLRKIGEQFYTDASRPSDLA
jgi:hypothetical protein